MLSSLCRLLAKQNRRPGKLKACPQRRGRILPGLEELEDRNLLATISWVNPTSGNWDNPANWSTGKVPGRGDDVVIQTASTATITIEDSDSVSVHSLTTGAKDTLAITGGTLVLAADSNLGGALTESNGVLTGPGTLTVNGLLTWTGGTMSGPGTTLANGGLQLGLNDGNQHSESLNARTLVNARTGTWGPRNSLYQVSGSSFLNAAGATLDIQDGATWYAVADPSAASPPTGTLINQGTLTIDALGGKVVFTGYFTNNGSVTVSAGTFELADGGTAAGSFTVAAGATILFPPSGPHLFGYEGLGNTFHFSAGAAVSGAGTVAVDRDSWAVFDPGTTYNVGTTFIDRGELVLNNGSATLGALQLVNGELGGTANMTVTGLTTWTGGTLSGSGTTEAKGGLVIGTKGATSDGAEALAGRTLINDGTAIWYARNTLAQEESSTFENRASASLDIQGGSGWGLDFTGTFLNEGTFSVDAGAATTQVRAFFNNSGRVQVNSGTLGLSGNSSATGSFVTAAGATLQLGKDFNYNINSFLSGATVSGAGTVVFGTGVAANFVAGSTYNVTGATIINTGGNSDANVVFLGGSHVPSVGALTIQSGVVDFHTGSALTVPSLNQSGGTLIGPDPVIVSGLTTWAGGIMSGAGTTRAAGGLTLGGAGQHSEEWLNGRTFVNAGSATWSGDNAIHIGQGGTFVNQVGATFAEQAPDTMEGDGTFDNEGTFTVNSGATARMICTFLNNGTVEIKSGTWQLLGTGSATGTFIVDQDATFARNIYYSGGTITGPGTVTPIGGSGAPNPTPFTGGDIPGSRPGVNVFVVQGNVTVSTLNMTAATLIVAGTLTVTGPMTWTGGTIVGSGTVIAAGGLTLSQSTGGDQQDLNGVTLVNAGAGTIFGQASITLLDGARLLNQPGATLAIKGGGGILNSDGTATLDNQGSITAAVGSGTTYRINYTTLSNAGSIAVRSGTLDLETGGTGTGSFSADVGSTLEFGHAAWAFNAGASVSGAGTVLFPFNYWSTSFNAGSTYNVTGTTVVQLAVSFLPGSKVQSMGALTLNSGVGLLALNTGQPVPIASLGLQDGVLTGSDTVTVSGPLTWTGGTMSGTGVTIAQGGLTIGAPDNSPAGEILDVRTLINRGAATVTGRSGFQENNAAVFQNDKGSILTMQGTVRWDDAGDNTSTLENDGTFIVDAGMGTATLSSWELRPPFLTNTGSFEVRSGTLDLQADGTSSGSMSVDAGATLEFYDDDFLLGAGSRTDGAGTVWLHYAYSPNRPFAVMSVDAAAIYTVSATVIDGSVVEFDGSASTGTLNESSGALTGPGTLTVSGLTTWTGGMMSGSGATVAAGGLQLGQATDGSDNESLAGRTFRNASSATWAGGGSFSQTDGSTFSNLAGASFTITNGLPWSGDASTSFANAGTLTEAAPPTRTTTFTTPLDNTGSVLVRTGTLSLQGGCAPGGTYTVAPAGTLTVGQDATTPASVKLPSALTCGQCTFSGSATDASGTGLASVGVSLFDGSHYWDGRVFESATPVFNPARLTGSTFSYTLASANFRSDVAYTVKSQATDKAGNPEASTVTSLVLAPAQVLPTSSVAPLPATENALSFTISWSGQNSGGPGIASYDVYVSDNGSALAPFLTGTTQTSAKFSGQDGHSYQFYCVATDKAGNVQATPTSAQATTLVDTTPPSSSVNALPAYSLPSFPVRWSGSDATPGSGVASYTIYVSVDGGPYTAWLTRTTSTSSSYPGQDGHSYGFYSVATDRAGNIQPTPTSAQATTLVDTTPPSSSVNTLSVASPSNFTVSWSGSDGVHGSGIASYTIYVSDDGGPFTAWLTATTQTSATYSGALMHTFAFYSVATDKAGNQQATPTTAQATTQVFDTPNQRYVAAAYQDLLQRPVDPGGLTYWSDLLEQGTPRSAAAKALTHGAEYYATIVRPVYQKFLGRPADDSGLAFWVGQMQQGLTDERLEAYFVGSAEFYAKAGGSDKGWVDGMYQSLLGRPADSSGETFWVHQLAAGANRSDVAYAFAASQEREGQHVQQDYQKYLGRSASDSEVAGWVGQFARGVTNEDIVTGFVASDEYFRKHTS
jgi:hypothetical protein